MRIICKRDKYRYIRLIVRFLNEKFRINHNTNFCVDTGAPYSLISYEQAVEWKIPFDQLRATPSPHRVGGIEAQGYILDNSRMLFRDFQGILHPIEVPRILVLGPPFTKKRALPVPALMGDDILQRFTLIVKSDLHGGDVILTDEDVNI